MTDPRPLLVYGICPEGHKHELKHSNYRAANAQIFAFPSSSYYPDITLGSFRYPPRIVNNETDMCQIALVLHDYLLRYDLTKEIL